MVPSTYRYHFELVPGREVEEAKSVHPTFQSKEIQEKLEEVLKPCCHEQSSFFNT